MDSIGKKMLSGTFYVAIAKYSNVVFQILITSILARILTPKDYGIIAIATVFIVFFNILSDIGIGPAIIQKKELRQQDFESLHSFNIYLGVILCLVFFLLSWPIACMYKDNETLRHVCQLLSFLILFTCARTVPINILYREKKFKYIAFSTLSVQILVGVIAIIAALCGLGVYALVLSQVLSAFFLFIIYWLKFKIKFKFKFSTSSFRKIYSYSVYSFVSSVIYYFSRNLDKILIAKYIGTDALGYYEKSYRLMFMPIDNITFVITPVLHPFFAELQNDLKGIARKYMKIVELLSFISFPLSIFLFFSSSELIMLFFGCQWTSSIPVFKIMALSVSTQMLTTTMGAMYNAVNATKKGFVAACISTILLVSSFILSIISFGTIESVATGFLISQTIFCFYNYYLFLSVLKYPYIDFIKVLIKPTIVAFVLLVLFYFESEIIGEINYLLSLVIKGVIFFLVLILAMELLSDYKPVTYVINKISIK